VTDLGDEAEQRQAVRKDIVDMCEGAVMTIIMKACALHNQEERVYLTTMVVQRLVNSLCMEAVSKVLMQDFRLK
jgi:hypothetical protein